ncbi:disease resistance protein RGA2-like [Salvia splendens]|uniref:disease resistance protein RGA2-like n=1 Tax=Salvia splendens TaxID=180675 RepID=UPI001C25C4C8|nr:disease resistance protein RGA2-like [Salvia splendens]
MNFNYEGVKAQFGSLLWVHVSQTFDPIILFKKILSTLTSDGGDDRLSREAILRKLQEALKDKKYLLVVDDVWNEDVPKWEDFMNFMSGVTSTMGNDIYYHHYQESKANAFDGNEEVPPQFESIGKKIAELVGSLLQKVCKQRSLERAGQLEVPPWDIGFEHDSGLPRVLSNSDFIVFLDLSLKKKKKKKAV